MFFADSCHLTLIYNSLCHKKAPKLQQWTNVVTTQNRELRGKKGWHWRAELQPQQGGCRITSHPAALLCGLYMFSLCRYGFSPDSSHRPKTRVTLIGNSWMRMNVCLVCFCSGMDLRTGLSHSDCWRQQADPERKIKGGKSKKTDDFLAHFL